MIRRFVFSFLPCLVVPLCVGCSTVHQGEDANDFAADAVGVDAWSVDSAPSGDSGRDAAMPMGDAPDAGGTVVLPDAWAADADLRVREDSTGFCRPDGTCVCFGERWAVCPGSDTICTNLEGDDNCGRCGRSCLDTTWCAYEGAGCSCDAGVCRPDEILEWWPGYAIFAPGYLQRWGTGWVRPRYEVPPTFTTVTAAAPVWSAYVEDGVLMAGRFVSMPDDDVWTPVVTEDRIRSAYAIRDQGFMISDSGQVYFTNGSFETLWRSEDLGEVQDVCAMYPDNYLVLLGDGRVLATGSNPDILGTDGVDPPEHGFVEVVYPRPVVSLACFGRTSFAILDDGTAWFAGDAWLPGGSTSAPLAPRPQLADLGITRRLERVFNISHLDGRMFCVASSEIGGLYGCWGTGSTFRFDPISFVWGDLPRLPIEVREGNDGICGRFELGGGYEEIRCIQGVSDARLRARLVWTNVRIGSRP